MKNLFFTAVLTMFSLGFMNVASATTTSLSFDMLYNLQSEEALTLSADSQSTQSFIVAGRGDDDDDEDMGGGQGGGDQGDRDQGDGDRGGD